ncbi:hypothetical protein KQI84_06535 [bacterium]|nr:hypothetical protein [bacterium]
MHSNRYWRAVLPLAAILLMLLAGSAPGQSADDLIKQANNTYRQAERNFHNGKHPEALKLVEEAAALLNQAKEADSANTKIPSLDTKITRLAENIRKRLPKEEEPAAASSGGDEAPASSAAGPGDKLPSGVSYRLREVDRFLKQGERAADPSSEGRDSEWRSKTARYGAEQGRSALAEIESKFSGQYDPNHPDIVAMMKRIEALEAAADKIEADAAVAGQAAEAAKAECDAWVTKLSPYITSRGGADYDPEKYFIPSATQDMKEMQERLMHYAAAAEAYAEYKKVAPKEKTDQLAQVERDFEYALKSFEEGVVSNAEYNLSEAARDLEYTLQFLQTNKAKADKGEDFNIMRKDQLEVPTKNLERGAALLEPNNAEVKRLRKMIEDINKLDSELRQKRVADARMIPDKFKGNETKDIKKMAEKVVAKDRPGAKIKRITIVSEDWSTENVIEFTDTTRSALQHRVTRSVSAQVGAVLDGDGHIYTVYVGSDRQPNGKWGPLKGHIMFDDPILEKNIDK